MSLSEAKTHWLFGEWDTLAAIDLEIFERHPDRAHFALLVASAHQQIGNNDKAHEYTRAALEWNCPPKLAAQILIAGVHNTLGRASALTQDESRTIRHFRSAIALGVSRREAELLSHARSVREMAKLGLLPQAASVLGQELTKTQKQSERPAQTRARIRVLETELELLNHALSLAQKRQQLFRSSSTSETFSESVDSEHWHEELKKRSVSQLGQDLWVLEQTGYKRGGFFVEFGATDGVLLNNTLLLEKEFSWNGICAEPNPEYFARLRKNRMCNVSNWCIGPNSGEEVEFVLAGVYGGILEYANRDRHSNKRADYLEAHNVVRLPTISLNDFLIENDAPRHIDYLSIDTEGSEFDILEAFPFEQWTIELISVEHNFTSQRKLINDLLTSKGYRAKECAWEDWFSLK